LQTLVTESESSRVTLRSVNWQIAAELIFMHCEANRDGEGWSSKSPQGFTVTTDPPLFPVVERVADPSRSKRPNKFRSKEELHSNRICYQDHLQP
jgi:hypothetical protein